MISSDLRRAVETAEILSNALNISEIKQLRNLRELHFGQFEGKPYKDLKTQTDLFDAEGLFRHEIRVGGGESLFELKVRIEEALNSVQLIAAAASAPLAIVSHGTAILMLCHLLTGKEFNHLFRTVTLNNSSFIYYSSGKCYTQLGGELI